VDDFKDSDVAHVIHRYRTFNHIKGSHTGDLELARLYKERNKENKLVTLEIFFCETFRKKGELQEGY
jgi:hypothetical protein